MSEPARILVFIPTYRCAPQIGRVLEQFRDKAVNDWFEEILVLDNQSPDGTAEAAINKARELGLEKVSVARNRSNYGLGGSHKAAFTYAAERGFTHVLTLHGDDQGDIRDILPILETGQHFRSDCCLGARFHPKAHLQGYSPIRIAGNYVFNWLFSLASMYRLYDLGSGLNLYQVKPLRSKYWIKFHDNLMFNYCMILAHVARLDRIMFFPISWREDDQLSNVKLVTQARRTLGILSRFVLNRRGFMEHDFRNTYYSEYRFDVLAETL